MFAVVNVDLTAGASWIAAIHKEIAQANIAKNLHEF